MGATARELEEKVQRFYTLFSWTFILSIEELIHCMASICKIFFLWYQTSWYQVKKHKTATEIHSDLASGQQSTKEKNKKEQLSQERGS